jgi:hypothetical protein
LVESGLQLGMLLIASFKSASRLLTSVSGILRDSVEMLAEEVGLITYAITRCGMGTVDVTSFFGCVVKKDWSRRCDIWFASNLFFFLRAS